MAFPVRRRAVIAGLGAAAFVAPRPHMVRAEQPSMPVVGYVDFSITAARPHYLAAFHQGLGAEGFVEGRNVRIVYREAAGRAEHLPALLDELVRRRVAVLATTGGPPATVAAKRATQTIPIVFGVGADPVEMGLVTNLSRPTGNLTGVYFMLSELIGKRLSLFHELLPSAKQYTVLVNPANLSDTRQTIQHATVAGRALGLVIQVAMARTSEEIDQAFETAARWRTGGVLVAPDGYFNSRHAQFASLAARYALPTSFANREFVITGGLMSYGPDIADSRHQAGIYVGRILKGAKPSELPVVQPTKFGLIVNARTARALGVVIPPLLLARIDEVIE